MTVSWLPHHALVAPEGEQPGGWILVLHGILGSGSNWRTIARRLVAARPDWGAVLVDLRMHGRSQDAPPPHALAAVAADLERLAEDLARRGMNVAGVAGHSFGGKAALALRASELGPELRETWVLDASPSARPGTLAPLPDGVAPSDAAPGDGAHEVLRMLESLPGQFSSRDEFLAAVTGRGFSRPLAEWLAMNLVADGERFRSRLDLGAIRALLSDYFEQDLWSAVEGDLPGVARFVVASRSSAVSAEDRRRLEALAGEEQIALHVLDAGHWLHLDAPDALLDLFTAELPRLAR